MIITGTNLTKSQGNVFDNPLTNPYSSPGTIYCQPGQIRIQKLRGSIPWIYNPFDNQMRLTNELANALSRASHLANDHPVQEKHLLMAIAELDNEYIWNIIKREMKCQTIDELKKKLNVESNSGTIESPLPSTRTWYLKVTDIKESIELDIELAIALEEVEADMHLLERRHKIVSIPDIVIKIFQIQALRSKQKEQQESFFTLVNKRMFNNLRHGTPITSVYRPAWLENYVT